MVSHLDIEHKLEDSGYRLTSSRRRLLEALLAREEGFTAEELVAEATGVGRATVYRTIRLLVEQGVLCKLSLEQGAPRYTVSRMAHHHHLVCVSCGMVREFRQNIIERVLKGLETGEAGKVVGHRIEVYVLCSGCQRATAKGKGPARHVGSHNH
ncbi:MAG: transcriptional repressor [Chloroflexi bacterium]|nr:transcriptional repressor [Chloroflexota bacterium]